MIEAENDSNSASLPLASFGGKVPFDVNTIPDRLIDGAPVFDTPLET